MNSTEIVQVCGRQVWDSRGRPTVEAEVTVASGKSGRAIAPSGASKGSGEAVDLRDGNDHLGGCGVTRAVSHVNGEIARALLGCDASCQARVDQILIELDGTANKARLGGNALVTTRYYGQVIRGKPVRWSHHDPRPCLMPPDWSGGYTSIFALQQEESWDSGELDEKKRNRSERALAM
jgi:hypothetical protein